MAMQPTYWANSDRTFAVQVHTRAEANKIKRLDGARRIAQSVFGKWLEVWEVHRTVLWARKKLTAILPDCREVWGGDWTDSPDFAISPQATESQENTPSIS